MCAGGEIMHKSVNVCMCALFCETPIHNKNAKNCLMSVYNPWTPSPAIAARNAELNKLERIRPSRDQRSYDRCARSRWSRSHFPPCDHPLYEDHVASPSELGIIPINFLKGWKSKRKKPRKGKFLYRHVALQIHHVRQGDFGWWFAYAPAPQLMSGWSPDVFETPNQPKTPNKIINLLGNLLPFTSRSVQSLLNLCCVYCKHLTWPMCFTIHSSLCDQTFSRAKLL